MKFKVSNKLLKSCR